MNILAIESSGLTAGIAVFKDETMVADVNVNYKKTHSQTLVPIMDEVTKMIELDLNTLDAIAVSKGPGSYTGLRIGAATAKGMGLALNIPIIEVPTLNAMAYNFVGTDSLVCPMMDAKRTEVFTGLFDFEGEKENVILESTALPVKDIVEKINSLNRKVILLGDGAANYRDIIESELKVPYMFAPASRLMQSAGSVGALGIVLFKEGKSVNARDHVPEYLKVSQAERERNEAMEKTGGN